MTLRALDGGLNAWVKNGNKLVTTPTIHEKAYFEPSANHEMIAHTKDVEDACAMNTLLLDARSKERYEGISRSCRPNCRAFLVISHTLGTNLDRTGRFKSIKELKHNFDKVSAELNHKNIISMCGSGITACHNILALEMIGIKGVRLYVGSWSEWITDPNRSIATIKTS